MAPGESADYRNSFPFCSLRPSCAIDRAVCNNHGRNTGFLDPSGVAMTWPRNPKFFLLKLAFWSRMLIVSRILASKFLTTRYQQKSYRLNYWLLLLTS